MCSMNGPGVRVVIFFELSGRFFLSVSSMEEIQCDFDVAECKLKKGPGRCIVLRGALQEGLKAANKGPTAKPKNTRLKLSWGVQTFALPSY